MNPVYGDLLGIRDPWAGFGHFQSSHPDPVLVVEDRGKENSLKAARWKNGGLAGVREVIAGPPWMKIGLDGGAFLPRLFFPAPLKNAIDWASRPPNAWADKPAAILSTGGSFGGGRAQYHLRQIGVYLDLHFINTPEFFLNAFQHPPKFDDQGNLIDDASKERIQEVLLALQKFTLLLKGKY